MPAAAVIPAPVAYIKVVAVKKLVVGLALRQEQPSNSACPQLDGGDLRALYLEKIRVFKAGHA